MTHLATSTAAHPVEGFCAAAQLRYLRAGEAGPAMVLLHGWGAFKELWWSTLLALAPYGRAFAPDLPGHGGSPLAGARQMSQVAARIAAFCAAHDLSTITLVGHSMGGNVAVELALAWPGLVQRLVLVDPAVEAQRLPAYTRSYLGSTFGWATLRISLSLYNSLGLFGRHIPHVHGGGLLRPALRRAVYHARHDAVALRVLLDGLFDNSLGQRVGELRVPTLVVSGEYDLLVPPALARRVAQSIPGARYAVIRGASHNPMDERPHAFEQVLLAFLGFHA